MKIDTSSYLFAKPSTLLGRTGTSVQSQSFGGSSSVSAASGPSVWSAIQRIQSILLDRQDRAKGAATSDSGGMNIYAENKSVTGNAVSGATVAGKFLDVKSVSMQYVQSTATDTKFTSKTVYSSSFDGDRTSITADRVQYAQVNGDASKLEAKTMTGGQIGGDNVTVNAVSIDGLLQIGGSGAKVTAGSIAYAQVSGQGASLTTEKLGVVSVNADNVTISAETAGNITLRGGRNTIDIGTATGAVTGGTGDDRVIVDSAAFVSGGKGNDTLTVGAGVKRVIFNAGDGSDVISAEKGTTITLGAGLKRSDLQIIRDGDTYRIGFAGSTDKITLNAGAGTTSKLTFADGTSLDLSRAAFPA